MNMSETNNQPSTKTAKERFKGWVKMVIGTIGGLLSGAAAMYVTPLVDKVVRPDCQLQLRKGWLESTIPKSFPSGTGLVGVWRWFPAGTCQPGS
jgi:hypothetical protein